jgi:carboxymethylenebutenolidase
MTVSQRYERIDATDGTGSFDAYCAPPPSGSGPGILLFQEIFGINDNMRGLADRLAGEGYVVLVPDMFWRLEPRFERKDESGMADAFGMIQRYDFDTAPADITATHAHLLAMPECTGRVGAVGFCFGGALAFAAAATSRVDGKGIDAAVCYYGSAINGMLAMVGAIDCPVMYHYGDADSFIPSESVDEVQRAVASCPGVEFHRYPAPAGHAFSNWDAPSMYHEPAAEEAWDRTIAFLASHLT